MENKVGQDVELSPAQLVISEEEVAKRFKEGGDQTRKKRILEIDTLETLIPKEEGMELNEGYVYQVEGSIPQLADAIAKLAIEMDKSPDLGEQGGGSFIALISQFYEKLKS
jgi:hypothetical protein